MANQKKISWKEIVWYSVAILIAAFGVSLIITHICGYYYNGGLLAENKVYQAEVKLSNKIKIPFDFMAWGFVFVVIGLVIAVVTLYYWAKKEDLVVERDVKRKQRLADQLAEMEKEDTVEAPVSEKTAE